MKFDYVKLSPLGRTFDTLVRANKCDQIVGYGYALMFVYDACLVVYYVLMIFGYACGKQVNKLNKLKPVKINFINKENKNGFIKD